MKHRISSGALIEHEGRVLLVRHRKEGEYDFWVAPGGGVQGTETLAAAAEREVKEETGLNVVAERLVYVEEFHNPDTRHCKFWFIARLVGGAITVDAQEAVAEYIVEAGWHSQDQVKALQVFPEVLHARYWQDRLAGFPGFHHLGLRQMAFW